MVALPLRAAREFAEQRVRRANVGAVEAFRESTVHLAQNLERFVGATSLMPEAGQAGRSAQLPRQRALAPGPVEGPLELVLSVFALRRSVKPNELAFLAQ